MHYREYATLLLWILEVLEEILEVRPLKIYDDYAIIIEPL